MKQRLPRKKKKLLKSWVLINPVTGGGFRIFNGRIWVRQDQYTIQTARIKRGEFNKYDLSYLQP